MLYGHFVLLRYRGTRHACSAIRSPSVWSAGLSLPGDKERTRSHVPCRQGCSGCPTLNFSVDKDREKTSVQLFLLLHLQAD